MKRIFVLLIVASFALSGCGASQTEPSPVSSISDSSAQESSPDVSSDVEESSEPESSELDISSPSISTFGITASALVEVLQSDFASSDLPNAFDNAPKVSNDSSEELGEIITYSYPIVEGAECSIYATQSTDEVFQVFVFADSSKMDINGLKITGGYAAKLIQGFEPDKAQREEVDKKLSIGNSNVSVDTITTATGTQANFTFIVDGGDIMLMINPLS